MITSRSCSIKVTTIAMLISNLYKPTIKTYIHMQVPTHNIQLYNSHVTSVGLKGPQSFH